VQQVQQILVTLSSGLGLGGRLWQGKHTGRNRRLVQGAELARAGVAIGVCATVHGGRRRTGKGGRGGTGAARRCRRFPVVLHPVLQPTQHVCVSSFYGVVDNWWRWGLACWVRCNGATSSCILLSRTLDNARLQSSLVP